MEAFAKSHKNLLKNCIPAKSILKISFANNSNRIVSLTDPDLAFSRWVLKAVGVLIIN